LAGHCINFVTKFGTVLRQNTGAKVSPWKGSKVKILVG